MVSVLEEAAALDNVRMIKLFDDLVLLVSSIESMKLHAFLFEYFKGYHFLGHRVEGFSHRRLSALANLTVYLVPLGKLMDGFTF